MSELSRNTRLYREKMLADPYRPGYHFALPDGNGLPGDPNGAFYADGRYHLMYLYLNDITHTYHWGHISSIDLLHWRHHPDALSFDGAFLGYYNGFYSGGAFVDDDETVYLTFWGFPSEKHAGGIGIAFAKPPYEVWELIDPIPIEGNQPWGTKEIDCNGKTEYVSCADPSNIWKDNGWYYLQAGNLLVLNTWGRGSDADMHYKGDWTDLFRSKDLHHWEYVHRFYQNPRLGDDWPDETEDDMCPSFLPLPDRASDGNLTDRMLQLFISHNKGGQYYIGKLHNETFYPEQHGRFTWADYTYFAPEALIDHRNRHIGWFWLHGNPTNDGGLELFDWSGVYGFPRVFWLENDILHMAPAEELERLQYNGQKFDVGTVDGRTLLSVKNGASFRIRAEISPKTAQKIGFIVRADEQRGEYTEIYVDRRENVLVMDTSHSGIYGRKIVERAPFVLNENENLHMDIFVDKSVIEVYVNDVQAIGRRVYPSDVTCATAVYVVSDGADYGVIQAWEMMETNMY